MDATLLANNSQHRWILLVASVCTSCCMFLKPVITFSRVQTDATLIVGTLLGVLHSFTRIA